MSTPTVAVALLAVPVITSPAAKSMAPALPIREYDIGVVDVIILACAPVDAPTILSPLKKEPVIEDSVIEGTVTSALVDSES